MNDEQQKDPVTLALSMDKENSKTNKDPSSTLRYSIEILLKGYQSNLLWVQEFQRTFQSSPYYQLTKPPQWDGEKLPMYYANENGDLRLADISAQKILNENPSALLRKVLEEIRIAERLLLRLNAEQRRLVQLRYWKHYSVDEICDEMFLSRSGVYRKLAELLKYLEDQWIFIAQEEKNWQKQDREPYDIPGERRKKR